jgi:hypothetical protein
MNEAERRDAIRRIRNRWPDPVLLTRTDCASCAPIGDAYSYHWDVNILGGRDAEAQAIDSALTPVVSDSWVRQCTRCGALFTYNVYKEPAADELFGATVEITRISAREAIRWLGGEPA